MEASRAGSHETSLVSSPPSSAASERPRLGNGLVHHVAVQVRVLARVGSLRDAQAVAEAHGVASPPTQRAGATRILGGVSIEPPRTDAGHPTGLDARGAGRSLR